MRCIEADGRDCLRVPRHLCVFRCYRRCWHVLFIRYQVDFNLRATTPNPNILSVCSEHNYHKLDLEAGTRPLLAHLVYVQSALQLWYEGIDLKQFLHFSGGTLPSLLKSTPTMCLFFFAFIYLLAAHWHWMVKKMQLLTVLSSVIGTFEVHNAEYILTYRRANDSKQWTRAFILIDFGRNNRESKMSRCKSINMFFKSTLWKTRTTSSASPTEHRECPATSQTNRSPKLQQWIKAFQEWKKMYIQREQQQYQFLCKWKPWLTHDNSTVLKDYCELDRVLEALVSSPTVNRNGGRPLRNRGIGVVFTWQRHCVCASLLLAD